jgi:hypothetical protein
MILKCHSIHFNQSSHSVIPFHVQLIQLVRPASRPKAGSAPTLRGGASDVSRATIIISFHFQSIKNSFHVHFIEYLLFIHFLIFICWIFSNLLFQTRLKSINQSLNQIFNFSSNFKLRLKIRWPNVDRMLTQRNSRQIETAIVPQLKNNRGMKCMSRWRFCSRLNDNALPKTAGKWRPEGTGGWRRLEVWDKTETDYVNHP